MYLRLGWVVGNAGFGGALLIILLAKVVTVSTGLSMASMVTNIKIGAGGHVCYNLPFDGNRDRRCYRYPIIYFPSARLGDVYSRIYGRLDRSLSGA